ncbi:MAG TPA: hypothetical protein VFM57_15370 [Thermoleophilaceae bacterium]|nr:hypothetical protein [Thermoleophilaceae bacterium]
MKLRKLTPAGAVLAVVVLAVSLALVPAALAGKSKPGGGGGGSYSVTVSPGGPYSFGQAVSITTNDPVYPNGAGPYIWLKCYQNGVLVGSADEAAFPGGWYYGQPFTLGPSGSWTSGPATCDVTVVHMGKSRAIVDASTSFAVNG